MTGTPEKTTAVESDEKTTSVRDVGPSAGSSTENQVELRSTNPDRDSPMERWLWAFLVLFIIGLIGSAVWVRSRAGALPPLPVIATVPDFSLTHFDGTKIGRSDLLGQPWVADFIFTRCIAVCPRMTMRMRSLVLARGDDSPVRFVSITVDPEHDTPGVLSAYAEKYDARKGWYFLSGSIEEITELCMKGFLLPLDTAPPAELLTGPDPIIHSNRFALVDGQGQIRGYYDAFDPREVKNLQRDLDRLLDASDSGRAHGRR